VRPAIPPPTIRAASTSATSPSGEGAVAVVALRRSREAIQIGNGRLGPEGTMI
jgi:hypothetical protein